MPVLCLGEALVDLVCERPVADLGEADSFVPSFGGAVANAAVTAARHGARVALAGGAGQDPLGERLLARLEREGVDTTWFRLLEGVNTPLALVAVDADGEPSYQIYGDGIASVTAALAGHEEEAVEGAGGVFISSNTLVGDAERDVTMAARAAALAAEKAVVFDVNLRLHRWPTRAAAAAAANACVPGALLVRATAGEAEILTGEPDPERAALAFTKAGARMAAITLGPRGAILRGEFRADAVARPADVVRSTIGAGDVFTGVLLARLERTGFYPAAVAAGLAEAVTAATEAVGRWSAVG